MQRFGTSSVSTAEVGVALLAGQWERAVELVLGPKAGEKADVARAREHWAKTKNARASLDKFPYSCTVERRLLGGIAQHGKDYSEALRAVPYSMRTLYVHSYQSLVWNLMVSHRMTLGLSPIVGDLVLVANDDPRATVKRGDSKSIAVKVLREEDLADHTIYDVVLPLPG
jgi:tRNA pseudouridine13 synthase